MVVREVLVGAPRGLGLPPDTTGTPGRVPGKEGNSREDGASSRETPVSTAAAVFRGPKQTPEKSALGPHPSPPSRPLTPAPHKVQVHPGPRGLPTVERQWPLLRPTATPPGLLCGPGSTIGGGGGQVDWGVGVQGQQPRAERGPHLPRAGGGGKDAQTQAEVPEQRGSDADAANTGTFTP